MARLVATGNTQSAAAAAAAQAKSEKVKDAKANKEQAVESTSFAMNLFRGSLKLDEIFPYPYTLNEEQRDNLQALVDPTAKFFEVCIYIYTRFAICVCCLCFACDFFIDFVVF